MSSSCPAPQQRHRHRHPSTADIFFWLVGIFDLAENRVFQRLTHHKYAENYADSESGNGFFLAPVQEWSMSKILLPKNQNLQKMKTNRFPWGPMGGGTGAQPEPDSSIFHETRRPRSVS